MRMSMMRHPSRTSFLTVALAILSGVIVTPASSKAQQAAQDRGPTLQQVQGLARPTPDRVEPIIVPKPIPDGLQRGSLAVTSEVLPSLNASAMVSPTLRRIEALPRPVPDRAEPIIAPRVRAPGETLDDAMRRTRR